MGEELRCDAIGGFEALFWSAGALRPGNKHSRHAERNSDGDEDGRGDENEDDGG
jgi:hypothetical protein